MIKRLLDIAVAATVLTLAAPIFVVVAIAVLLSDGAPVFYRQTRTGLAGEPFKIIKFRTMVRGADRIGGHSTEVGDCRITPLGKVLRTTSLDELPQLLNVLVGDMSLVGPRPDALAQANDYRPEELAIRNSVRPGITGPAQARYRSAATFEQRLSCDLDYARNHGIVTDIKIIGLTARQLVRKGGY